MMELAAARHSWPEKSEFSMFRKNGTSNYTFLHFYNSVYLHLQGETILTKPHACLIYNIDTPQIWFSKSELIHDWMHITGDVIQSLDQFGLATDTLYYPRNSFFITDIVSEIEIEYLGRKENYESLCNLKLTELFLKLSRECKPDKSALVINKKNEESFQLLRLEIFTHLDQAWNVPDMAAKMNFSQARFFVIYKNLFGISPVKDIILARIEMAKRLLSQNKYTVMEISQLTGYTNEYHFIRQFKSITGTTPKKYASH